MKAFHVSYELLLLLFATELLNILCNSKEVQHIIALKNEHQMCVQTFLGKIVITFHGA